MPNKVVDGPLLELDAHDPAGCRTAAGWSRRRCAGAKRRASSSVCVRAQQDWYVPFVSMPLPSLEFSDRPGAAQEFPRMAESKPTPRPQCRPPAPWAGTSARISFVTALALSSAFSRYISRAQRRALPSGVVGFRTSAKAA